VTIYRPDGDSAMELIRARPSSMIWATGSGCTSTSQNCKSNTPTRSSKQKGERGQQTTQAERTPVAHQQTQRYRNAPIRCGGNTFMFTVHALTHGCHVSNLRGKARASRSSMPSVKQQLRPQNRGSKLQTIQRTASWCVTYRDSVFKSNMQQLLSCLQSHSRDTRTY
jgi:hypothetical protein